MSKIIYLSNYIMSGINAISELSNNKKVLEHLDPIDNHFILFSTLYQSGVDYIQIDKSLLPEKIANNPFWSKKFIDIDKNLASKSFTKAFNLLKDNFDHEEDQKFLGKQYFSLLTFFSDFFYSTETGIPFVNPKYATTESFKSLESRLSKELFHAITIFYKQAIQDSVTGITPQYTALKGDIKRFNEITESIPYTKYTEALQLLNTSSKIELVKKDIRSNALKLQSKYAGYLSLKDITFSFIKLSKKLLDLITGKAISLIGDSLIATAENASKKGNRILYYKVEEAHHEIQFANRFGEYQNKVGKEVAGKLLDELKNKK